MVTSQLPEIVEEGGGSSSEKVYVAVGKSVDKAVSLLRWVFEHFGNREICLLHVHRPSPLIPTLCKVSNWASILVVLLWVLLHYYISYVYN